MTQLIKLIAVDMDGTFLNDNKEYDKTRFAAQLKKMTERDIKFVVASGNQFYTLNNYFSDFPCENIAYVAENGAYVSVEGKALQVASLNPQQIDKLIPILNAQPHIPAVVCGEQSAYILESVPEDKIQIFRPYYARLKKITSYDEIDDKILKVALWMGVDFVDAYIEEIKPQVEEFLTPVSSGHGFVDLIIPGVHKANGIQILQKQWQIKDSEIVAFGDSGNDIEMLKHAGFSYAMENAKEAVKITAKFVAPSNNEHGVLEVIDQLLK